MPTNSYFVGADVGPKFAEELEQVKKSLLENTPLKKWWDKSDHPLHLSIAYCNGKKDRTPGQFPKTTESVQAIENRNRCLQTKIQGILNGISKSIFMVPHDIEIADQSGYIFLTFNSPCLADEDPKALHEIHNQCIAVFSEFKPSLDWDPKYCGAHFKPHLSIGRVNAQGKVPTAQEIQVAKLELEKYKKEILKALTDLQKIQMLTLYQFNFFYNLPLDHAPEFTGYRHQKGSDSVQLAARQIPSRNYGVTGVTLTPQNNVQVTFSNDKHKEDFRRFVFQFGMQIKTQGPMLILNIDEYEKIVQGKVVGCNKLVVVAPKPVPVPAPASIGLDLGISSVRKNPQGSVQLMFNTRGPQGNADAAKACRQQLTNFGITGSWQPGSNCVEMDSSHYKLLVNSGVQNCKPF